MEIITAADILTRARDLLAKPGVWAKKPPGGDIPIDCYCAETAYRTQYLLKREDLKTKIVPPHEWAKAGAYLRKAIGVGTREEIWEWNDAPERTLDDVLSAYDRAIRMVKGEE